MVSTAESEKLLHRLSAMTHRGDSIINKWDFLGLKLISDIIIAATDLLSSKKDHCTSGVGLTDVDEVEDQRRASSRVILPLRGEHEHFGKWHRCLTTFIILHFHPHSLSTQV